MHIGWIPPQWPYRAMPRGRAAHCCRWAAAAAAAATTLLAVTAASAPGAAASGTAKAATPAKPGPVSCGPPDSVIQCYTPREYQVAYGVVPLLKRGITGNGETVVMPELAHAPGPAYTDIRKDLAAFDLKFGLPTAKLKVTTTLAGASAPYVAGHEETEDTEIVHDRARCHPRRGPGSSQRHDQRVPLHRGRDRADPRCHYPARGSGLDQRQPW